MCDTQLWQCDSCEKWSRCCGALQNRFCATFSLDLLKHFIYIYICIYIYYAHSYPEGIPLLLAGTHPFSVRLGCCSLADAGEDHTTQRMGPDVSWSCKVASSLFCCHFDKFVWLQPLQPLWNNPFNMPRLCFQWHVAL